jgi:hypothetical protein
LGERFWKGTAQQGITWLGGHDHFADWPQGETSEFHMRSGEWDPYNGDEQHNRCDEVSQRQPPTGEDKP